MTKPLISMRRQQGWALTDTMLAIVAFMFIMVIAAPLIMNRVRATRVSATARQLVDLSDGAIAYQSAYLTTITGASGPSTPYTRSVAQLIAAGSLPAGFSPTNRYGQTLYVSWITPASGVPQPVIVGTGGASINDGELIDIANDVSSMHGEGAYISNSSPSVIQCAQGTCNPIALSDYGYGALPGHVAVAVFKQTQTTTDVYLHRDNDGIAAHSTMNQDINMNTHALNNAGAVHISSPNVNGLTIDGSSTNSSGLYINNSSSNHNWSFAVAGTGWGAGIPGSLLFYDNSGGGLRAYLDTSGALNFPLGGNAINIGGSRYYGDSTNMALRTAANGGTVYLQGTAGGGGTANLYVTGNTTAVGSLTVGGNVQVNGSQTVNGNDTVIGSLGVSGNATVNGTLSTGGQITAGGNAVTNGAVVINGIATIGAGCATRGAIAQSSSGNGEVIECKSGRWTAMGGGYNTFAIIHGPTAFGFANSLATCPAGYDMLGGGSTVVSNPYGSLPGSQSWPYSTVSWAAESTDGRVGVSAWALCAM